MNHPQTAFVVEDNGVNRIALETILEENKYAIAGSFSNAEDAWVALKNKEVDIVLIDINLSGIKDGIWLGNKIRKEHHLAFVYLTAYGDQETIQKVKDTQPNGYLMKPYNEPTLLTTIDIAIQSFKNKKTATTNSIFIKDNYVSIKLNLTDVLYIQSEGNYLEVFLEDKKHLVRAKLTEFLSSLPKDTFLQAHRRFIVNTSKISLIGNGFVKIQGKEIPVSKTFESAIKEQLNLTKPLSKL